MNLQPTFKINEPTPTRLKIKEVAGYTIEEAKKNANFITNQIAQTEPEKIVMKKTHEKSADVDVWVVKVFMKDL